MSCQDVRNRPTWTEIARLVVVFGLAVLVPLSSPGSALAQSIGSRWGTIGRCSTGTVRSWPINDQIARAHRCLAGVEIVPIEARPNIRLTRGTEWAQAQTRDAVYAAAASQGLQINTAYRTMLEQTALSDTCTSPAAAPGHSNHETGTAVDLQQAGAAQTSMVGAGCRYPNIPDDPWHYNCPAFGTPNTAVLAFQRLWNLNNPSDMISADNAFGPITRGKLMASPIAGFADDGCGPPPPPPSCDDTAGGFTFSCDGVEPDQTCVSVNEPDDPDSWSDNYLCAATDVGLVFSTPGPVDGMRCANLHESADAHADSWADDYACVPEDSTLDLAWSNAGPIDGYDCVRWNETADPGTWSDNYLCVRPAHCTSAGDFTFCNDGPADGMACTAVNEPEDPDSWDDNYFCSAADIGMLWSHVGALVGMNCTAVTASDDTETDTWTDNYLCLPTDAPYDVLWSESGPVAGMDCVRWYEPAESEAQGRTDDYLCLAPASTDTDAGVDAGAISSADAHVDGGDPSSIAMSGGCACRAAPGRSGPWAPLACGLTLLGLVGSRARRRTRR